MRKSNAAAVWSSISQVLSRRERLDLERLVGFERVQNGAILTASGRVPNAMSTLFLRFMQASVSLRLQDGGRAGICRPFSFVIPLCKASDERNASQHA